MHNMLDHDREELEQITPYVLSRPKILRWLPSIHWKQDDPDGYLSACSPILMIPPFLPNLVYFFSQLQMKRGLRKQYMTSEL